MNQSSFITVEFPDDVLVRVGNSFRCSKETTQHGCRFGDWYVIQNLGFDAIADPDSNFDVGHNPTGLKVIAGLTFWEARRVALAMSDADMQVTNRALGDPDGGWIVESIIASALMDHYVFPLTTVGDQ